MSKRKKFVLNNIKVERYAAEGKCIAHHHEKVIFVEGAIPGDVVNVLVHRNKKDWAEGIVYELVEPSPIRTEPFCKHFGICGGCKWQMLPYALQAQYKEEQVQDQLKRIGGIIPKEYRPIKGCEVTTHYRNKLEFTFANKQYLTKDQLHEGLPFEKNVLGFHVPGVFFDKILDIEECHLMQEPMNAIRNFVRAYSLDHALTFYDIRHHHGLMRNLMIRLTRSGEIMVNLVFGENQPEEIASFMDQLRRHFPEITSLFYTINTKANDTIYDQDVILHSGKPYITEMLENYSFKISPKSFFQTNSYQAVELYRVIRQFLQAEGHEVLYDLYCGTGSIGLFLSAQVKKIIGVDTVADAIADARENALLNGVENATFFDGDVIHVCTDDFFKVHEQPDVVIIDPPRAGCHEKLLETLLRIGAAKMIYVSCNPATQARDLKLLATRYEILLSQAVDMFPHTHHIENVVLLRLKG